MILWKGDKYKRNNINFSFDGEITSRHATLSVSLDHGRKIMKSKTTWGGLRKTNDIVENYQIDE